MLPSAAPEQEASRAPRRCAFDYSELESSPGLPEARGQTYILPAGAFFDLKDGKISRVTTFYNLRDWIAQVSK